MKTSIGIFGGSFDPVHLGHKKLADEIIKNFSLSKMLIIPAALSPFKNSAAASCNDRLNMCRLMFSDKRYLISDIEIQREGKSYTIDTLKELKKIYPHEKFYLIIGSDQFLSFNKWYNYKEILKIATIISVCREKEDNKSDLELFAEKHLREFGECIIMDFNAFVISSTDIRAMIRSGRDITEFVGKEVGGYIYEKGLYKNV